jgi:serine/threonine protein phosphatase 1
MQRSGFDYEQDELIQLGDIADGFYEVYECIEELLKISNLIAIKGNHDDWFDEFIRTGHHPQEWVSGALATARSYLRAIGKQARIVSAGFGYKVALNPGDIPEAHQRFFRGQHLYYIDEDNNCFVHAGFNRHLPFKGQRPEVYYWDRDLWEEALSWEVYNKYHRQGGAFKMVTAFNEVFIGHTSTVNWGIDAPMKAANIYNVDTGAGHSGRLTIMDLETKQFWQSDPVNELYDDTHR